MEALAQIEGGVIDVLSSGVGPEVEGITGSAAFEAMEGMLLQVDGEAAAGARRGPVQWAWTALLHTVAAATLKPEQLQNG